MPISFRVRWRNPDDDWSEDVPRITDDATLARIRQVLENRGPVIIEHRWYRGSAAPSRLILDDYDDFLQYLQSSAFAGDAIDVWSYTDVCDPRITLASGKCPDPAGQCPRRGAY
jgi:hypothetical protein